MSALVKFVSLVGFASMVNGCVDNGSQVGICFADCVSSGLVDITEHVDKAGCPDMCCGLSQQPVCPPCTLGCDENFNDPTCITYEDYLIFIGQIF